MRWLTFPTIALCWQWEDQMQQDILIIGVLFPVIPLMMVNFGNRYTVLANLIRHLHDEVIRGNVCPRMPNDSFYRLALFATECA